MLAYASFHPAIDILLIAEVILINALKHEKVLLMSDDLRINGVESAPTERKIIESIEEISLSLAVLTDKAIHLW
jgi:hypothetical protein